MIKTKIKRYIESNLLSFNEEVKVDDDENIFDAGYVNSMFSMQLLAFVEKEFQISIENVDIDPKNFSTINNLEVLVKRYVG